MYYGWVMYGAAATTLAWWWSQAYYYRFLYLDEDEYVSKKPNFTWYSTTEHVNYLSLLVIWVLTSALWLLSCTGVDEFFMALLYMISFTYYFNIARILVVMIFKYFAIFLDSKTDYA